MERREFLVGIGAVIAAAPLAAVLGCGGGSSSSPTAEGFTVESTIVDAHTHILRVLLGDLEAPPAGGVVYATSVVGHAHTVALTQAELLAIQAGGTVGAVTSVDVGHQHAFAIRRP